MTVSTAFTVLKLLLTLAAYFAKRAERQDIERRCSMSWKTSTGSA